MRGNLSFEEDGVVYSNKQQNSGLAGWLVRHSGGFIKSNAQANSLLLIFIVTVLVVSFLMLKNTSTTKVIKGPGPSFEELRIYNEQQQH